MNKESKIYVFTDGSFNESLAMSGYGYVFVELIPGENGKEYHMVKECKGIIDAPESRQIVGECQAAIEGYREAAHQGYKNIVICHDYIGVASWIRDGWRTKTNVAKNYVRQIGEIASRYKISKLSFLHVKGHSGNRWNDRADELAQEAIIDELSKKD